MDLSTFFWSVAGGLTATAIAGTAVYKSKIIQKGNSNNAYSNSTVNINSDKQKESDNKDAK